MVQRIQKAKSRHAFEREERLASERLGGDGNKKNRATNVEAEDYDEGDVRMISNTKETAETKVIMAGTYEQDHGGGVQGRRAAGQTGAASRKASLPRNEKTISGEPEDQEDSPTGKWSRQKVRAKLSSASGNAKATKRSSRRSGKSGAPEGRWNQGRRAGKRASFGGRNVAANQGRPAGIRGKRAATGERSAMTRAGRSRRNPDAER